MNFQIERLKRLPLQPQMRWQGGLFRMPAWVLDEGPKPYRPWSAFWVNVTTHTISSPTVESVEHKDFPTALDTLVQFACDKKLGGHRPGTIEVKDPDLAEYLQDQLADTGITVICRQRLLVFDEVLSGLTEHMCEGTPLPDALSAKRVTLDMMRSFAEAAETFYKAKPWRHLSDMDLIAIEAPFVDPLLRYASILGSGGMTFGIAFYDSADMFEEFVSGRGMEVIKSKPYWTLFFGGIEELPFGDADLWEDHDLPIAGPQAYPLAMCYDPMGKHRRPQPDVLVFLEGLLRAFAQTSEAQIDSGRWQKTVRTFDGEETYTLALPGLLESAEEARKRNTKHGRLPDRRGLEKIHLDIQRILDGHEFADPDEMQDFINENIVGKPVPPQHPVTPLEQAQDLCYEAFEARGRKQIQLARKALEVCPDCADAYVILAEACSEAKEAHDLYAKGAAAGERLLGEQFFKEEAGHFWGILQTRPYMRARLGLAQALENLGRLDEAISHYQEMLRLNPNDNQGVRDFLLPCLLIRKRLDEAQSLWRAYKDDGSAIWNYGKALLTFLQKGDNPTARKYLRHALEENEFVPDYLLEEAVLLPLPSSYSPGSEEEAIICADILRQAWQAHPEALEWLEEHLD